VLRSNRAPLSIVSKHQSVSSVKVGEDVSLCIIDITPQEGACVLNGWIEPTAPATSKTLVQFFALYRDILCYCNIYPLPAFVRVDLNTRNRRIRDVNVMTGL
jgi:hypothetical protein